jgi:membrane-associated protease RseP (regulator of RpoE activity)
MKRFKGFGFHLVWLMVLPLASCLASASVAAGEKKTQPVEKKQVKMVMIGADDEEGCGCGGIEGQIQVEVITDEHGHHKVIKKVIGGGKSGFLGVHLVALTPELRKHYTKDEKTGVLVAKAEADSPASKAGLVTGDVIVSVDGKKVASAMDIGELIGAKKAGDKAKIGYFRNGARKQTVATLIERKRCAKDLGKILKWHAKGGEMGFHIDEDALGKMGEMIELEVLDKLDNPNVKMKILKIREHEENAKHQEEEARRLEEKMKKVEKRLRELEKKLQGRLMKKRKATTT